MVVRAYSTLLNNEWSSLYSYTFNFIITSSYVLCLYLIPTKIRALPRNNPLNIKYRVVAATICSCLSVIAITFLVTSSERSSFFHAVSVTMGIKIDNIIMVIPATMLLMAIFYLGPLVAFILYLNINTRYIISDYGVLTVRIKPVSSFSIIEELLQSYYSFYGDLVIFRNIIFAPISEEIVFRAVIIASLYIATLNTSKESDNMENQSLYVALLSPTWFALAHIHHLYDKVRSGVLLQTAILSTSLQVTYTSIFGYISAILFMRTGSIFSSILSHMICNFIGLPDIGFLFSSNTDSQLRSSYSCLYDYRYLLIIVHVLGLVIFSFLLFPVTNSFAIHSFYWQQ